MDEQIIAIALTLGAAGVNIAASVRAFYYALFIDARCKWLCKLGQKTLGLKLLIGVGVVCMILALMKLWSIGDIFLRMWDDMHPSYHFRSFAYLAENYGVGIIGWMTTTLIYKISQCDHKKE